MSGLEQVIDRLLADADAQLQAHHLEAAQQLADAARAINPNHPRVAFLAAQIGAQRERSVLSQGAARRRQRRCQLRLAVLDDATARRASLDAGRRGRQQLAQKQVDARVADFLGRAHDALAAGALLQPPEQNARFFVESARALAPNNPAVQQARADLNTRLLSEAHQSVAAGNAEAADNWIAAAADSGADPAEVESLRTATAQLRGRGAGGLDLAPGNSLQPAHGAGPRARALPATARATTSSSSRRRSPPAARPGARTAFETRLTDEARAAVHAQDLPPPAAG